MITIRFERQSKLRILAEKYDIYRLHPKIQTSEDL